MGNKMTGLIISDPFASKFHIQFTMKYGDYIDTIPGISNLGKHMILKVVKNMIIFIHSIIHLVQLKILY